MNTASVLVLAPVPSSRLADIVALERLLILDIERHALKNGYHQGYVYHYERVLDSI